MLKLGYIIIRKRFIFYITMPKSLENCKEYGDIFKIVKRNVKEVLGTERVGFMLILSELPAGVAAMHYMGSNSIVLNKSVVESLNAIEKAREKRNYVIYGLLLHEYIHTLGYVDERTVRSFCWKICEKTFGKDHLTTKMAYQGLGKIYPELAWVKPSASFYNSAEMVSGFDTDNISYIA